MQLHLNSLLLKFYAGVIILFNILLWVRDVVYLYWGSSNVMEQTTAGQIFCICQVLEEKKNGSTIGQYNSYL
jgi:hypothetical protein